MGGVFLRCFFSRLYTLGNTPFSQLRRLACMFIEKLWSLLIFFRALKVEAKHRKMEPVVSQLYGSWNRTKATTDHLLASRSVDGLSSVFFAERLFLSSLFGSSLKLSAVLTLVDGLLRALWTSLAAVGGVAEVEAFVLREPRWLDSPGLSDLEKRCIFFSTCLRFLSCCLSSLTFSGLTAW